MLQLTFLHWDSGYFNEVTSSCKDLSECNPEVLESPGINERVDPCVGMEKEVAKSDQL